MMELMKDWLGAIFIFLAGLGIILGAVLITQSSKPAQESKPDIGPIEFIRLEIPLGGESQTRQGKMFRNQVEWDQYWQQQPPEIPVDFEKFNLVLVEAGEKPTGGFTIAVKSVIQSEKNLTVQVEETRPGSNCLVTQAFSYPVDAVLLSKIQKEVSFEFSQKIRDC